MKAPLPRTWIVCEDAGAAANLAPTAALLARQGALAGVLAGPAAAPRFEGRARVVSSAAEVDFVDVARDAECVLTGSSPWGERLEARAVLAAREVGRPSVTHLDYWANYAARLSFPSLDRLEVLADHVAVVDLPMQRDLLGIGVPAGIVSVTGAPAFDALWQAGPIGRPPRDGSCVLFVSQPLEALYGTTLGYTERSVLVALAPVVHRLGAKLVIRPHPREDAAALATFVSGLAGAPVVTSAGTTREAAAEAHCVVGMSTMALVEIALAGRATISVQLDAASPIELPTIRLGATQLVTREGDIEGALQATLGQAGGGVVIDECGWSPGATERLAALLTRAR